MDRTGVSGTSDEGSIPPRGTMSNVGDNLPESQRPRVGIGVFLFNDQGQLLLGERKSDNGTGTWAVPGGHLEWMESWEDCAIREVAEETGLKVKSPQVVEIYNYPDRVGDRHYVDIWMVVEEVTGVPQTMEPDKCVGWQWFDPDSGVSYVTAFNRECIFLITK